MTKEQLKEILKEQGIETENYYPKTSFVKDGVPHIGCFERELKEDFYFYNNFDRKLYKVEKPSGPLKDIYDIDEFNGNEKFLVPQGDWILLHSNSTTYTDEIAGDALGEELPDTHFNSMTLRQYACIHLKVPNSGLDWLDSIIKKAKQHGN